MASVDAVVSAATTQSQRRRYSLMAPMICATASVPTTIVMPMITTNPRRAAYRRRNGHDAGDDERQQQDREPGPGAWRPVPRRTGSRRGRPNSQSAPSVNCAPTTRAAFRTPCGGWFAPLK